MISDFCKGILRFLMNMEKHRNRGNRKVISGFWQITLFSAEGSGDFPLGFKAFFITGMNYQQIK